MPLHALVLRRRPEDLGLRPDGARPAETDAPAAGAEPDGRCAAALGGAAFWWLALAFSLATLVSIAQNVHLVPVPGRERLRRRASARPRAGLSGAMQAPARIVFGPLVDRLPMRRVTAALLSRRRRSRWRSWWSCPACSACSRFAVVFGRADGAMTTARPALLAELYGRANYGAISGSMTASGVVARALAPLGIGAAYDLLGTYVPVWWALAALALLGGAAVVVAGRGRPAPAVDPARTEVIGVG